MKTKFILLLLTLFLFTPSAPAHAQNTPPSVFYGWVTPSDGFTPSVGMSVTGLVSGQECGATAIIALEGQLAYVLHVNSADDVPGCGSLGDTVVFRVGSWEMDRDAAWDNRQANFWPLSVVRQPTPTATPTIAEPSTPTPTDTPVVITPPPTKTPTPPPTAPSPTETPTPSTQPSETPTEPTEPSIVYLPLVNR